MTVVLNPRRAELLYILSPLFIGFFELPKYLVSEPGSKFSFYVKHSTPKKKVLK